jgi:type III secretory pathway component EscS
MPVRQAAHALLQLLLTPRVPAVLLPVSTLYALVQAVTKLSTMTRHMAVCLLAAAALLSLTAPVSAEVSIGKTYSGDVSDICLHQCLGCI